jgi:hypothetical protein
MFDKASNKRSAFNELRGSAVFRERIAPKIADHIQGPINVRVAGENTCLNAWLIENLSTIASLHIRLTGARLQRPARNYRKKAKHE